MRQTIFRTNDYTFYCHHFLPQCFVLWGLTTRASFSKLGSFYQHGLTLIPAWISNRIPYEMWGEIPFPNFSDAYVEVLGMGKWFHPTLYNGSNYLSMLGSKLNHASERDPWWSSISVTASCLFVAKLLPEPVFITTTSQWARWRLKSPASRLFTQFFIQGADQRKHQNSASLALVRGIHWWPVKFPHKRLMTRKMFPFDDVIISFLLCNMSFVFFLRCINPLLNLNLSLILIIWKAMR